MLTYWKYAPRVKMAAALLDDFFAHSRRLLVLKSSRAYTGFFAGNIQQVPIQSTFNESNFPKQEAIRHKLRKYHSYPNPQNGPTLVICGTIDESDGYRPDSIETPPLFHFSLFCQILNCYIPTAENTDRIPRYSTEHSSFRHDEQQESCVHQ